MEKREILLPSKRYFKANEEDVTINVKLEGDAALLRQGERDIILDLPTLFNDERVICQKYKIYGKIKTVFRNMYSGTTDYNPLLINQLPCFVVLSQNKIRMGLIKLVYYPCNYLPFHI